MLNTASISARPCQSTDLELAPGLQRVPASSEIRCRKGEAFSITGRIEQTKYSLLRSPNWRWDLARDLVDQGRRGPRKSVDRWLLEAVRYQRDESRGASPETLACRYPAVAAVHEIHRRAGIQRRFIEAWLLTGGDDVLISRETGIGQAVVDAYEQLFFNVRGRLEASDYVLHAIARSHRTDSHPRAMTVQRLGHSGGPDILKSVLEAIGGSSGLLGGKFPEPDLATAKGRNQARIQLLLDIQTLDMDRFGPSELQQLHEITREIISESLPNTRLCADWSVVWRQLPAKRTTAVDKFAKEGRSTSSGWTDLIDISQKLAA